MDRSCIDGYNLKYVMSMNRTRKVKQYDSLESTTSNIHLHNNGKK